MKIDYVCIQKYVNSYGKEFRKKGKGKALWSSMTDFFPRKDELCGTIMTSNCLFIGEKIMNVKILGKLETKSGFKMGFSVYDPNGLSSTLMADRGGFGPMTLDHKIKWVNGKGWRIRKFTPRECWRLMSFSDADFEKAKEVNGITQLYSQAGNSICECVLKAIFKKLIEG